MNGRDIATGAFLFATLLLASRLLFRVVAYEDELLRASTALLGLNDSQGALHALDVVNRFGNCDESCLLLASQSALSLSQPDTALKYCLEARTKSETGDCNLEVLRCLLSSSLAANKLNDAMEYARKLDDCKFLSLPGADLQRFVQDPMLTDQQRISLLDALDRAERDSSSVDVCTYVWELRHAGMEFGIDKLGWREQICPVRISHAPSPSPAPVAGEETVAPASDVVSIAGGGTTNSSRAISISLEATSAPPPVQFEVNPGSPSPASRPSPLPSPPSADLPTSSSTSTSTAPCVACASLNAAKRAASPATSPTLSPSNQTVPSSNETVSTEMTAEQRAVATYQAYYSLALAYLSRGDGHQALKQLDKVLKKLPTHVDAVYTRAGLHLDRQDYPSAARDYSLVYQQLDPGNASAAEALEGILYHYVHQALPSSSSSLASPDEAKLAAAYGLYLVVQASLQPSPRSVSLLAPMLLALAQYDLAAQLWTQLLETHPTWKGRAHFQLGTLALAVGNTSLADEYFSQAMVEKAASPIDVAERYEEVQRYRQAVVHYERELLEYARHGRNASKQAGRLYKRIGRAIYAQWRLEQEGSGGEDDKDDKDDKDRQEGGRWTGREDLHTVARYYREAMERGVFDREMRVFIAQFGREVFSDLSAVENRTGEGKAQPLVSTSLLPASLPSERLGPFPKHSRWVVLSASAGTGHSHGKERRETDGDLLVAGGHVGDVDTRPTEQRKSRLSRGMKGGAAVQSQEDLLQSLQDLLPGLQADGQDKDERSSQSRFESSAESAWLGSTTSSEVFSESDGDRQEGMARRQDAGAEDGGSAFEASYRAEEQRQQSQQDSLQSTESPFFSSPSPKWWVDRLGAFLRSGRQRWQQLLWGFRKRSSQLWLRMRR